MTLALAGIDAMVGAYLIVYALRRERRDKDAVLVVGIILLLCSTAIVVVAWPSGQPAPPAVPASVSV